MFRVVVEGCEKRFGSRVLFRDLSLTLIPGSVIGVAGANGSGKSTLSQILLGQQRPSKGTVRWLDDEGVITVDERRRRSWLIAPYLVWYDQLTAEENLRFVMEVTGRNWDGREFRGVLEYVGLGGRGDETVSTYSSGMQQRLKIAAAFLLKPDLIILDEPGTTLDEQGRLMLRTAVNEWQKSAAVSLASNDPEELSWCTSTVTLTANNATGPGRA